MPNPAPARILSAELLSVGSELTVGETRDTNSAELARDLTARGVEIRRISAVPDDIAVVTESFKRALATADLVVSTGGLGPTPDDLTREAIADVLGEAPEVDPELEAWLRERFARRGLPFPEINLKQAWRIPSCEPLANPNGTAPGWFVRPAGGRVVVALPGPPREMRPMWTDHVLPQLEAIGLGRPSVRRTFRLTGIGESHLAEVLGEGLLRGTRPQVATYARAEAVDVRVSAAADEADGGIEAATALVDEVEATLRERLGAHIWATGDTTWSEAIGERLATRGWDLAVTEVGTAGSLAALLGDVPWVRRAESVAEGHPGPRDLLAGAHAARDAAGADVGVAVHAVPHGDDTAVRVAVVTPDVEHEERRLAFLGGTQGRTRAALAAAAVILATLAATASRSGGPTTSP